MSHLLERASSKPRRSIVKRALGSLGLHPAEVEATVSVSSQLEAQLSQVAQSQPNLLAIARVELGTEQADSGIADLARRYGLPAASASDLATLSRDGNRVARYSSDLVYVDEDERTSKMVDPKWALLSLAQASQTAGTPIMPIAIYGRELDTYQIYFPDVTGQMPGQAIGFNFVSSNSPIEIFLAKLPGN